jgi:hypothetical protein
MKTEIDGIEVLSLEVELYGELSDTDEIDLGALYLSCDGREYILDVTQSYTTIEGGFTHIRCDLERDDDTFPPADHKYDLKGVDLMMGSIKANFYIASDLPIEKISFFVRGGFTRAIDVIQE